MDVDRIKKLVATYPLLRLPLYPAIRMRSWMIGRRRAVERDLLRRLAESLVEDPVLRVEEFDGVFAVDARGDLFTRLVMDSQYEPELVELVRRYVDPQRDMVDVGANVGFFSVLCAKLLKGGRVLAVEPTPMALSRLRRNVELNGVTETVTVFEGAVLDREGSVEIKVIPGKEEYSSLGEMAHPSIVEEEWETTTVVGCPLDRLAADEGLNPGFMKVDVEGAEHLVFRGAKRVLSDSRPVILSELSDELLRKNGSSAKEVVDLLVSYDYDVRDPLASSVRPGYEPFGEIVCLPR